MLCLAPLSFLFYNVIYPYHTICSCSRWQLYHQSLSWLITIPAVARSAYLARDTGISCTASPHAAWVTSAVWAVHVQWPRQDTTCGAWPYFLLSLRATQPPYYVTLRNATFSIVCIWSFPPTEVSMVPHLWSHFIGTWPPFIPSTVGPLIAELQWYLDIAVRMRLWLYINIIRTSIRNRIISTGQRHAKKIGGTWKRSETSESPTGAMYPSKNY